MKALITAGGRATRLRPITWTLNKHLIPLANKPMLAHAVEKVVEAGITDIAINVNVGETEIQKALGDGSRWGAHITYIEQVGGPKGLGHILSCARGFLGDDDFVFYLGDNIILGSIVPLVEKFKATGADAMLALAKVRDPQRFGVPVFEGDRIVRVEEKPSNPRSDFAVTGLYCYRPAVWEAVAAIAPSPRGEYEISDVHSRLIADGRHVAYQEITGWWKDTGKPKDLIEGNMLILSERSAQDADIKGTVHPDASLVGAVEVGEGTVIGKNVTIRGPVSIGADCVIRDAYIGPYTSVGSRVRIEGAEVEHSVVLDDAVIACKERVVDSIIGRGASIISAADALPNGHRLIVGDNSVVEL